MFIGEIINEIISEFGDIDFIGFHGQTIEHDSSKKISINN